MDDLWGQVVKSLVASGPLALVLGFIGWKMWVAYQGMIAKVIEMQAKQVEVTAKTEATLREHAQAQNRVADVIEKCPGPVTKVPTGTHLPAVGG